MTEADNDVNKTPKSEFKVTREDVILVGWLVSGVAAVVALVILTPASDFVLKPARRMLGISGKKETASKVAVSGTGVYSLGQVEMSLGRKSEYIDSEVDLEYDRGVLQISSSGKIVDSQGADSYFRAREDKIKDAIIMRASAFSSDEVGGSSGMRNFKEHLLDAVNGTISEDRSVVTNVYSRKFIVFPPD